MLSWKERIGNEIKMLIDGKEVIGTVYEGYRYRDGMVSIHGYDGKDYSAGISSYTIQKTENTLPDLLDNFDYIHNMTREELADWLAYITKSDYKWSEWLKEEHK